jgi:hypothetical protein
MRFGLPKGEEAGWSDKGMTTCCRTQRVQYLRIVSEGEKRRSEAVEIGLLATCGVTYVTMLTKAWLRR